MIIIVANGNVFVCAGNLHFAHLLAEDDQNNRFYRCDIFNPYLDIMTGGGSYTQLHISPSMYTYIHSPAHDSTYKPNTNSRPNPTTTTGIAFPVAAARLWDTLPLSVTSASSISVFRKHLKTHLFRHSFPNLLYIEPVQWLCNFGNYNRSFYNLTYLLTNLHAVVRI